MGAAVSITRLDLTALELRKAASGEKNSAAARRILALALVLDGVDRKTAAETCGMDRQTLSGKSTLAVGLAVAAMENGERVAFVEADPQGTISKWKERRGSAYPRVDRVADPAEIERALSRLEAEGIGLAIIDTAATNNALAMRAIARADLCLIPARPSPADIEAAIPTLIAIRRLNRRFAFVLNQTPPRGGRLSEAATSLNSLGVLALPYVVQRNDHQDALGTGLGVTEFAQEGKASEEVRGLWRWVLKKLVEGSTDHGQYTNKAALSG